MYVPRADLCLRVPIVLNGYSANNALQSLNQIVLQYSTFLYLSCVRVL